MRSLLSSGISVFVVTAEEMRAAEQWAVERGISTAILMDRAGQAVAEAVRAACASRRGEVVVLVGPGNNGGDGLVAAVRLARAGYPVTVASVPRRIDPDEPLRAAREAPLRLLALDQPGALDDLHRSLERAAVIVDALLGTGVTRPLAGLVAEAARAIGSRPPGSFLIAVDLPSGVNSDTGAVDPLTPAADLTVTFAAPKVGMFLPPGLRAVGDLQVADIGIPPEAFRGVRRRVLTADLARSLLPARPIDGHKGTFGKLLVIAGSARYLGAPLLTVSAALRVGVGLVTLATGRSTYERVGGRILETTYLPLPEDGDGALGDRAAEEVIAALERERYDALALGPGLGRAVATDRFVARLLAAVTLPTVVDADALNAVAGQDNWPALLRAHCVMTPHPGEAARLLRSNVPAVEADRLGSAAALSRGGAVVVLKGAHTIVANPEGEARFQGEANPALGSGGTGDILTGIIGGLLAQGCRPFDAAMLGVYLHSRAAARWSGRNGDAGLLASDLLREIPLARRELRPGRRAGASAKRALPAALTVRAGKD
ncbi:MAG: NAD(P)H-hydrate dehydratase [Chloroflexota bacterium]|nr:NAD(P)H-hydrate dehydratase [Dehalococcoidia bacterium]MDW8254487.1 NAD(P)H-hydrate dehydratase [Chloroflexota bacterium]